MAVVVSDARVVCESVSIVVSFDAIPAPVSGSRADAGNQDSEDDNEVRDDSLDDFLVMAAHVSVESYVLLQQ